jgi:hypothetical protein
LVKVKIKDRLAIVDNNKCYKRKKMESGQIKGTRTAVSVISETLKTKLEALRTEPTENENEQVEQQWNIIKQAVIEAATETTGKEERMRNEWYEECTEAIREKMRTDYVRYRGQQDKHMINTRKVGKGLIK